MANFTWLVLNVAVIDPSPSEIRRVILDRGPKMERQPKRKIVAMLFVLSIAGTLHVSAERKVEIPRKEISEYKSWLKVTPTPHRVELTIDGIAD
jgi:hypothetical protein